MVIANKNAPRQCVLSGPAAEIERSRQMLGGPRDHDPPRAGLGGVPQPVRRGCRGAVPRRRSTRSTLRPSTIPVFANATAEPYPDDPEPARALLAGQLARPVEFVAQIEAMYRMGARTFLEVGPDAKLTGLVRAILEGRDHLALAVDASRGSAGNLYDLACSLASLAALGYAVDLTRWDEGAHEPGAAEQKAGLTVKICGANARPKVPATTSRRHETRPVRAEADGIRPTDGGPAVAAVFDGRGHRTRRCLRIPSREITPRSIEP